MRVKGAFASVLLLAVLAGCGRRRDPVVIGMGYPDHRVGRLVEESLATLRAAGQLIELDWHPSPVTRTARSALAAEVDRAAALVRDSRLIGVVHHGGSREALMTTTIYNENNVPVILATATSRRLRGAGRWTFQLAPDDSVEGEFIGRFVVDRLGARTATVFYVVDEYGMGLRDGIVASLRSSGARVVDAVPVEPSGRCAGAGTDNAYAGAIDGALRQGRPDLVILAARQIESGCIIEYVRGRFPAMRFVTGDGVLPDSTFVRRAADSDSVFVVGFWHPERGDTLSRDFQRRFEAAFQQSPTAYDAMIYDAHMTMVDGILAGAWGREAMRAYLASLGSSRPPRQGVTGPISFPPRPERLVMQRLVDGRLAPAP